MLLSATHRVLRPFSVLVALLGFVSLAAQAESAYVRVSQVGYEVGSLPARAYLMSTASETNATFKVVCPDGHSAFTGKVGSLLGTWANSKQLTYKVYALDFVVPRGRSYTISVAGPVAALSPKFAVDVPDALYPGLLVNSLFFYETQRDGADFIQNALRDAPGHLKDKNAKLYETPPLDDNDLINNVPPAKPLTPAKLPNIDADGGWWDAGDYEKYVETISYTTALMEIGVRDFPAQMGPDAPLDPPAPPNAVSYAGDSGAGSPRSADFSAEAKFGIHWLLKMWDNSAHGLPYQVDNTQDWNYYGEGDPASAEGGCGGTYNTPYCLLTEYDIWTLPQAADNYKQDGDPGACDPFTTFFICNRPVYVAPRLSLSPNLAGRLAADFALCYQLNREQDPTLAKACLKDAEEAFALADTRYPDPAPSVGSGSCPNCLLTIAPFDGYPETVWGDDMELGATELSVALRFAHGESDLPAGLPHTDPNFYLRQAASFAKYYIAKIYKPGFSDTLNLYDVSGLAHFELYRALKDAGDPQDLDVSQQTIGNQLLYQVNAAVAQSSSDPWGFGVPWSAGDTTSHGAGLSVMASEAYSMTHDPRYNTYSQRWLANILGANSWGSSFIVGDGSTFPNCIQHQVANLAGALDGTAGGTPILWGAATEGPDSYTSSGVVGGMKLCPANGVDTFAKFNGNPGAYNPSETALFQDNVQSYSTTEPGIDLTATSFLMWSWRMAEGK
ncbi:secreted hydrolase [Acidisarcina polymorpha]|uniref:Secreted hydrolase n=1 Tax=Acidisarcina polymorpha TaxID=2211140 RepID=A0A2Z5G4M9_9BACT|nr:glycoside hydrolase family 9 protein [Acidisarcina polymorpha]AXC14153.1 secreted hydrolase [Acidisarcina polymorpha]